MTLCREEECFACRVGGVVKYSKKQAVPAPEAFLRSSSVVLKAKGTRWGNCLVCIFHPSCSESGFERLEPEAKSQLETLCCWQFSYEVIWVWFWASSIRPGRKGLPRTSRTLSRIVPAKEALSSRTPSARVLEPGSLLWCPGSQIFFRSTKNDIPHTPSTAVHVLSKSQSPGQHRDSAKNTTRKNEWICSWAGGCVHVIPTLGRLRQEDVKSEASLGYINRTLHLK